MAVTELTRRPPPGAPVSDLIFRVVDGNLISTHTLEEVAHAPDPRSSARAELEATGVNPPQARLAAILVIASLVLYGVTRLAGFPMVGGLGSMGLLGACGLLIAGSPRSRVPAGVALGAFVLSWFMPWDAMMFGGMMTLASAIFAIGGWVGLSLGLGNTLPDTKQGSTVAAAAAVISVIQYGSFFFLPEYFYYANGLWWIVAFLVGGLAGRVMMHHQ